MQPIGGGWAFLRYLLQHRRRDPCYIGYLWPIWDSHKQTFADKIMSTYVIHAGSRSRGPTDGSRGSARAQPRAAYRLALARTAEVRAVPESRRPCA